jgi:hypothetical protein
MNCSSSEALFERFLDNELTPAQRDAVIAHVDGCTGCRDILEELRVVDALLIVPRRVELAPNFTFATMAEARSLPPPAPYVPPVRAYLVSYLAAAWLLAGAAYVLAPLTMHALAGTLIDIARGIADTFGALGGVVGRMFARGGSVLTAVLAALLAFDLALVAGCTFALRYVRPRLAERLRS